MDEEMPKHCAGLTAANEAMTSISVAQLCSKFEVGTVAPAWCNRLSLSAFRRLLQEVQLSPRDRAMRRGSSHAKTTQLDSFSHFEHRLLTDEQTQTQAHGSYRGCIASRGKTFLIQAVISRHHLLTWWSLQWLHRFGHYKNLLID